MQYALKIVQEDSGPRYMLSDNAERTYGISELLFDILKSYQLTNNYEQTLCEINKKYISSKFTAEFIERSVGLALDKIKSDSTGSSIGDGLYCKIPIIKKGNFVNAYNLFSKLFCKKIFYSVTVLSVFITALFFYHQQLLTFSSLYRFSTRQLSFQDVALSYALFTLITMFHETGHASAAKFFKVEPGEIGFAFYFIFPVFYTNVTSIWQLPVKQRNVVNLGGIYFQLIVNVILIVLCNCLEFKGIVTALIISNTISIIGSLNPFFKYDGYWIFSDTFCLSNLNTRSQQVVSQMVFNSPFKTIKRFTLPLLTYSVLKTAFWAFVYINVGKYIYISIPELIAAATGFFSGSEKPSAEFYLTTVILLMLMYLILHHFLNLFNIILYERNRIFEAKRYTA